jgi:hypothetical protein
MTTSTTSADVQPPAGFVLFDVMQSFVSSFAVIAAAELGIADALAGGPRTADELAEAIDAHAPSVGRLLRVLTPAGVVAEVEGGRFGLTPMGASLQTGGAAAVGAALQLLTRFLLPAFTETPYCIRTGKPAFERVFGEPLYEYLESHPEDDALFGQTMRVLGAVAGPITDAYDFSGVRTLVDVGGGQGWRMIDVLKARPQTRGIIFDRPNVVEQARRTLAEAGVGERCDVVGGSFFDSVPPGGDCYLLSGVIANWDDAAARTILRNTREAMPADARLLLFEPVLPAGPEPHITKVLDLLMLVLLGGQARTESELADLLGAAGLRLVRVLPTQSPFAIVEAIPA